MGTSWMFLYEADIGAETCSQRASGSPLEYIFIKRDPAGNIKPDKEKSTEKIDGAVALIMALDRAIRCGRVSSVSIYDERDLLVL